MALERGSSLDGPNTADMQEFEERMLGYALRDSQLPEEDIGPFIVFLAFKRNYRNGELKVCPGSMEHQTQLWDSWKRVCATFAGVLEGIEQRPLPDSLLGASTTPLIGLPETKGAQAQVLDMDGVRILRVLTLVHQLHGVRYCPLLVNFVQVLLHYLPDALCFEVANHLLSDAKDVFFETEAYGVAAVHFTFKAIFRSRMPETASLLQRHGVMDEYCTIVLDQLFVPVLPFRMVMRILDDYLQFGMHALFRFGLGLITNIKSDIKAFMTSDACKSAEAWRSHIVDLASAVNFHELWRDANGGHGKNLRFKHMPAQHILANTIQKVASSTKLRSRLSATAEAMEKSAGSGDMSLVPLLFDRDTDQLRARPNPDDKATDALLLGEPLFRTMLARWLPRSLRHRRLRLVFSTSRDGYNLAALLSRLDERGGSGRPALPSLLVVKDKQGHIFGCFATSQWRRMPSTFGAADSALFNFFPSPGWFPNCLADGQMVVTGSVLALGIATVGTGFGFMVDGDLNHGSSSPVGAFSNPSIHLGWGGGRGQGEGASTPHPHFTPSAGGGAACVVGAHLSSASSSSSAWDKESVEEADIHKAARPAPEQADAQEIGGGGEGGGLPYSTAEQEASFQITTLEAYFLL